MWQTISFGVCNYWTRPISWYQNLGCEFNTVTIAKAYFALSWQWSHRNNYPSLSCNWNHSFEPLNHTMFTTSPPHYVHHNSGEVLVYSMLWRGQCFVVLDFLALPMIWNRFVRNLLQAPFFTNVFHLVSSVTKKLQNLFSVFVI